VLTTPVTSVPGPGHEADGRAVGAFCDRGTDQALRTGVRSTNSQPATADLFPVAAMPRKYLDVGDGHPPAGCHAADPLDAETGRMVVVTVRAANARWMPAKSGWGT
jgi:hypothetical protein